MKNRLLCLAGGIILLIGACTPLEDRQEAGPIVPASDFTYTITHDADSDFILYLKNTTPGVMFSWDYAWGVTRKATDTVRMLVPGTYTVKITATTAGGIVTTTKDVVVTMPDPNAFQEPEWAFLTNFTVGKTWIWDDAKPAPWGNGGFMGCSAPCWWAVSKSDLNGRGVGSDEMKFDLNGGRHLTLTAASVPWAGITTGTFNLTFGSTSGTPGWDVGKLTVSNTAIVNGILVNNGNMVSDNFYVLKLTNTEFVLSINEPGQTWAWGTAWFWMFKPKP
jgi:PKD repeat protein